MNKTELNKFLNRGDIKEFIGNDKLMLLFVYDQCPMYIVKENIGVGFYLQFDNTRDYSRIKEFVLEAKPILSKMLEEKRNKELFAHT